MEIVQEMGRSFLIVDDDTPEELRYMRQMLTYNRISGIVPCQKGLFNNREVLKYDITNMKTLSKSYETGQMTYRDLRGILEGINAAISRGRSFLFDDEKYMLVPEYIYIDIENESISLIYIPYEMENRPLAVLHGIYYELADFFLDRVNHKDEGAVSVVYQFYRMSKESLFSLEAFESILEKEKNSGNSETKKREVVKESGRQTPVYFDFDEKTDDKDISVVDEKTRKSAVPICIIMILMAVLGAAFFFYSPVKQYMNQIIVAEIVLGTMLLFLAGRCVYMKYKSDTYDDLEIDENVTLEEFWSADIETQFFDDDHTELLNGDETQFFEDEPEIRHTIEWEEKGSRRVKEIRKEENILGKKYDEVDLCISDPSISRRHAKIIIGKKGKWVQDLDSTNGTFVDGNRLLPGENVKIDESSEIRFGKVTVSVV